MGHFVTKKTYLQHLKVQSLSISVSIEQISF